MKLLASISALILAACLLCAFGQLPMGGVTFQPSAAGNTWTTSTGWSATGVTSASLTCTSGNCTAVTVPATVAGDLLYVEMYNVPQTLSAGPAGVGTWAFPTNCRSNQATAGQISCGYVLSTTAGVTSIAMTNSATSNNVILHFRSYHPSSATAVAETVPAGTNSTSCSNNCTTATVTLSGTSDLIIAAITTGNTGCSVGSPYAHFSAPAGDGIADQFNATSGTGATFTQGSSCPTAAAGTAAMSTIAFK